MSSAARGHEFDGRGPRCLKCGDSHWSHENPEPPTASTLGHAPESKGAGMSAPWWHRFRQGPCRRCGHSWYVGWMVPNAWGVCSMRCLKGLIRDA